MQYAKLDVVAYSVWPELICYEPDHLLSDASHGPALTSILYNDEIILSDEDESDANAQLYGWIEDFILLQAMTE